MNRNFNFKPQYLILLGYFLIALIFSFILLLPFTHKGELSFIDSLFTSVSALCVTGLIVKDTGVFWTIWGKMIILFLIQIGGLGYMTIISYFFLVLKGGVPISMRMMTRKTQSFLKAVQVKDLILKILIYSFVIETLGFFILLIFTTDKNSKFFNALFHSISAFCNAGFSTYSENLKAYTTSPFYLITVSFLFIIGGIGFFVLDNIFNYFRNKEKISYHTKVVLKTTFFLISFFFLLFLALEWGNSLKSFDLFKKIVLSFFHVTTPRTAGFNSIDISTLSISTLFILVFLMIIGGSPGGTAGGIKTTNFAVWAAFLRSIFKGEEEVYLAKRRIEPSFLIQSATILTLYIFLTGLSVFLISAIENGKFTFLEILFEVVSAFSTVGLSYGSKIYSNVSLSADFSSVSKFIIILLMIIGRIGVFTFWSILVTTRKPLKRYPKGEFMLV